MLSRPPCSPGSPSSSGMELCDSEASEHGNTPCWQQATWSPAWADQPPAEPHPGPPQAPGFLANPAPAWATQPPGGQGPPAWASALPEGPPWDRGFCPTVVSDWSPPCPFASPASPGLSPLRAAQDPVVPPYGHQYQAVQSSPAQATSPPGGFWADQAPSVLPPAEQYTYGPYTPARTPSSPGGYGANQAPPVLPPQEQYTRGPYLPARAVPPPEEPYAAPPAGRLYPWYPSCLEHLLDQAPGLAEQHRPVERTEPFGPLSYVDTMMTAEGFPPTPPASPLPDPLVPVDLCHPPILTQWSLSAYDPARRVPTPYWDPASVTWEQLVAQLWITVHHLEWQKLQYERALWHSLGAITHPPTAGGPPHAEHYVHLHEARATHPNLLQWQKAQYNWTPQPLPQSLVDTAYRSWPLPAYVQAMTSNSLALPPGVVVPRNAETLRRQAWHETVKEAARAPLTCIRSPGTLNVRGRRKQSGGVGTPLS